ncbi:MAG: hypothetical protein MJZ20_04965 [Bacteroidaceae bacterium]|nr:hypothetical protein [Bacteroidaceae bacterium]
MVKEGRKKMTASAFKNAVYTLTHKVYNGPKFLWIGQQGVPEWLLYENLDIQERCAVDGAYRMYAKRETEKAVLIEFDTEFGYITMWAPKSVVKGF